MTTVSVTEAKAQLSRLLNRVVMGEEFVITRHGKAVAMLVPLSDRDRHRARVGQASLSDHS